MLVFGDQMLNILKLLLFFLDFGADLKFVILEEFGTGYQEAVPFHSPVFSRL